MNLSPPQAPKGDGEVLLLPPAGELAERLATGRRQLAGMRISLCGVPAAELRARAEADVTRACDGRLPRPWIITGHQPGMIHAGVWFKDAVLGALAEATGGTGIHVVADLDSVKHPDLKIPFVERDGSISVQAVEFADPHGAQSYAQLTPPDPHVLENLIQQATEALVWPSIFPNWAALARGHLAAAPTLARWLAAGRSGINELFGLSVRDVFLSDLVSQDAFVHFAAEVILRHEQVHRLHEEVLEEYRLRHAIKDRTQPVPDLGRLRESYEVPLWVYRQGQPRQAVFVCRAGNTLELHDSSGLVATLPAHEATLPAALRTLMDRCIFLAPRALTLTMYLRLFLADTFVHGIGGAVYDEVTDALMQRWLGVDPPPFITASATVLLPLPHNGSEQEALARARWQAHHAYHNPERYAEKLADEHLLDRKHELLERMERAPRLSEERAAIFHELQRINAKLRERLPQSQVRPHRELDRLQRQAARDELAGDREYFFAFMPREKLLALSEQARAWAAAGLGTRALSQGPG